MPKWPDLVSAVVVLGGLLTACGRSPQALSVEAPVAVVGEYLTRDSRGERLQPSPWFRSVSAWADEPGWDALTLIHSFRVESDSVYGDSARVRVAYEVVGSLQGTPEGTPMYLFPGAETQRVEFVLARVQDRWLVASPSINPHVLADSILVYRPNIVSGSQAVLLESLLRANSR